MKCKECEYFTKDEGYPSLGKCEKIVDSTDVCLTYGLENEQSKETNVVYTFDYESYKSGAYVGEDFGCIHFKTKG